MQQQQKAPTFDQPAAVLTRYGERWASKGWSRSTASAPCRQLRCWGSGGIAGALAGKASDRAGMSRLPLLIFVMMSTEERKPEGCQGMFWKKLPSHVILKGTKAARGCCCPICLQDVEEGEIARTLPLCQHTFRLACVDKWLSRPGSCPLCRRDL